MNKFLHFNINLGRSATRASKRKWQSRTVAAEPLDGQKVKGLAEAFLSKSPSDELFAYLNVGITFLSFQDKYDKKVGRTEAMSRQKLEKLKVKGIVVTPTHIFVNLESLRGVSLNLRTSKVSGFSTVTGDLDGLED